MLTGAIGRGMGPNTPRGDRRNIDDASGAGALHDTERFARAEKRSPQIGGDYPVPCFDGQLVQGATFANAGVVDQEVQMSESFHSERKGVLNLLFISDVG